MTMVLDPGIVPTPLEPPFAENQNHSIWNHDPIYQYTFMLGSKSTETGGAGLDMPHPSNVLDIDWWAQYFAHHG